MQGCFGIYIFSASALIIAPPVESSDLTGQITDTGTGESLPGASVRLLTRESMDYYLWDDDNGEQAE